MQTALSVCVVFVRASSRQDEVHRHGMVIVSEIGNVNTNGNGAPASPADETSSQALSTQPLGSAATPSKGGGPTTVVGKNRSRKNAIKHGLTAATLQLEILGPTVFDRQRQQLVREWSPVTPTERILVDEMARHSAALERIAEIEPATLRCLAGIGLPRLPGAPGTDEPTPAEAAAELDCVLSSLAASEALDRLTRYRKAHERGFYRAKEQLQELRDRRSLALDASVTVDTRACSAAPLARATVDASNARSPRPVYRDDNGNDLPTESECIDRLAQRFSAAGWACPRCGHAAGYWLRERRCWECGSCRRQVGLRAGTVMERSSISLLRWATAIALLERNRDLSLEALRAATGINRRATLLTMMARIGDAIDTGGQGAPRLGGFDGWASLQRLDVSQRNLSQAAPAK